MCIATNVKRRTAYSLQISYMGEIVGYFVKLDFAYVGHIQQIVFQIIYSLCLIQATYVPYVELQISTHTPDRIR